MIPAITASKIYSTLGNNNSLVPLAIKDVANSLGLTAGSYVTGDALEGKDRFLDEFGTQAIWLLGIPGYKKLTDLTLYKLCKIDPNFDVRNLSKKRSKLLEKSIKYADESIKGSMLDAVKNPKYTKNLAMTKFVTSTALAIVSYIGLTKYRHFQTKKAAEKEILEEMKNDKQGKQLDVNSANYAYDKSAISSKAFDQVHKNTDKQPSFTGSIQDFMFNPVKNLMILDGAITTERLADSRNKQELIGYTIKEGTVWAFMYFASKPIQKFLESSVEKNKQKPASIDLDARVIESEELKNAFKNGELAASTKKVLSLQNQEELLDYIHNNPDDFVVKMAKKSDVIPVLEDVKQADNVDYRKFIDLDDFKGTAEKLAKLQNKFEEFKNAKVKDKTLEAFLDNVKNLKRKSILKNMGACIAALGILAPLIMIAVRKMDKDNNAFQVKEDLKKELIAKGKI